MEHFFLQCDAFQSNENWATWKRIVQTLLHDMIHKEVNIYVDNMILKLKSQEGHVPYH